MVNIIFFSHYHNGDVFHSKAFVLDIMEGLDVELQYAHNLDYDVLGDLKYTLLRPGSLPQNRGLIVHDGVLYINTWVGCYFDKLDIPNRCTLEFNHAMYSKLYPYINDVLGTSKKIKKVHEYLPSIDYSKMFVENVNQYLVNDPRKKVLVSNGSVNSGQCSYNGDMSEIIESAALIHPFKIFILTHPTAKQMPSNVILSNDLIKKEGCDLNEISYASTFCDLIIGRNSGPYCFTTTKNNLSDKKKTFYCFTDSPEDCFTFGLDVRARVIHKKFDNVDDVSMDILTLLNDLDRI